MKIKILLATFLLSVVFVLSACSSGGSYASSSRRGRSQSSINGLSNCQAQKTSNHLR